VYEKLGFKPIDAIFSLGTATTILPDAIAFLMMLPISELSLNKGRNTWSIF
jgi:hypothetical protein